MKHLVMAQTNMTTIRPCDKVGFVRPFTAIIACGNQDKWDNSIRKRC
jgi:hypothetical protein